MAHSLNLSLDTTLKLKSCPKKFCINLGIFISYDSTQSLIGTGVHQEIDQFNLPWRA